MALSAEESAELERLWESFLTQATAEQLDALHADIAEVERLAAEGRLGDLDEFMRRMREH